MNWDRKSEWKTKKSLAPGQNGTLKMTQIYGRDLLCVRYRYNGKGFRIKTVELVVSVAKVK